MRSTRMAVADTSLRAGLVALCVALSPSVARAGVPVDAPVVALEPPATEPLDDGLRRLPLFVTSTAPGLSLYESTGHLDKRWVASPGFTPGRVEVWESYRLRCDLPCNVPGVIGGRYFVDGKGRSRSQVFTLAEGPTGYRVDVRPGSSTGKAVSAVAVALGVVALFAGVVLHVDANAAREDWQLRPDTRPDYSPDANERQHTIGTAMIGAAWVALLAGGLGLALTATQLNLTPVKKGGVRITPGGVQF